MGAAIVVVLVALCVTVGIGVLRGATAPIETLTTPPTADPRSSMAVETIYVHVSGAVQAPGLYVLGPRARGVDAIAAAGGFAEGADEAALNLARPLSDGEQLHVPTIGAVPGPAPGGGAGPSARASGAGPVDLNTADVAALDTLPRVGPATAQRIVEWREANGRFTSVDDLLAVTGIGPKTVEGLRELVTV